MTTDKPTSVQSLATGEVSQDTLDKLASRDEDIRNSGKLDIFQQVLPEIPADYVFKTRDRHFVGDVMHAAFELIGGVPRFAQWAHQNPSEYYKLYARMMPEVEKANQGAAIVQVFHGVPQSPLDGFGEIIDDQDDQQ